MVFLVNTLMGVRSSVKFPVISVFQLSSAWLCGLGGPAGTTLRHTHTDLTAPEKTCA